MERMIEFDHVSKSYRDILFEDACLTVNKGDVFCLRWYADWFYLIPERLLLMALS